MIETAVVVDTDLRPIHWHTPRDRSAVHIADSRDLWDVLWEHRSRVGWVVHSHPGSGQPGPSATDLTTFAACEAGLGRRLKWGIISKTHLIVLEWAGPDEYDYQATAEMPLAFIHKADTWLSQLHKLSYGE